MGASDVFRVDNVGRMGLLWTYALLTSYFWLWVQSWRRPAACGTVSLMPIGDKKPACIVTGASSGIGKATAAGLARQGYHVILAGRSLEKLQKVIDELEACQSDLSLQAMELDLCSIPSIFSFVEEVKSWLGSMEPRHSLDLLVNNAGILAASKRWSPDGFDLMMASNYFGPFILSRQLVPILQKSSSNARIVNVVSFTHRCVKTFQGDPDQLAQGSMQNTPKTSWYRMARIYETSKLCMLLFTYELHHRLFTSREYSRISVMAVDPGAIQTEILREIPIWLRDLTYLVLKFLRLLASPASGAAAVINAAIASEDRSGEYFFGEQGTTLSSSALSNNKELAADLWQKTSTLCDAAVSRHISH